MKDKKITIKRDDNAEYGGIINFASWGIKNELDAFKKGFSMGYTTLYNELEEIVNNIEQDTKK